MKVVNIIIVAIASNISRTLRFEMKLKEISLYAGWPPGRKGPKKKKKNSL